MIEITSLTKSFFYRGIKTNVLKNINFKINKGDKIALIGRNGAGKSTLLNLIGGIEFPDKGNIKKDCSISWPIGKSAGFYPDMTGRQNSTFILKIFYGNKYKILNEKLAFIKEYSELGESFDKPFNIYSRGMKSRLSFTISLAFDFDVYLLDEIMGGGDEAFKIKTKQSLNNLIKDKTLIMVTHSLDQYLKFCHKAILLNNGKLTEYDNVKEAINEHKKILSIKNNL